MDWVLINPVVSSGLKCPTSPMVITPFLLKHWGVACISDTRSAGSNRKRTDLTHLPHDDFKQPFACPNIVDSAESDPNVDGAALFDFILIVVSVEE